MRCTTRFARALVMASVSSSALAAAASPAPISLHPDNPHYFLWRGEPTVLVTSAEFPQWS